MTNKSAKQKAETGEKTSAVVLRVEDLLRIVTLLITIADEGRRYCNSQSDGAEEENHPLWVISFHANVHSS